MQNRGNGTGRRGASWKDEGKAFTAAMNNNGSTPSTPTSDPDEEPQSKSFSERFAAWRKQSRATLAGIPRALKIVWESHKGYTIAMAVLSVIFGIIPTATAWVGKLLIDAVVAAIGQGGAGNTTTIVIELVAIQFLLLAGSSLLQTIRDINQQALQELTARRVQLMLMKHANNLDLSFFENP